jgi:hypothetical protein
MNPGPAISVFSTHSESGREARMDWATSLGLRFSALASCMAALQAKSPWLSCLGRSSSTAMARAWGNWARAWVNRVVRWALGEKWLDMGNNLEFVRIITARPGNQGGLPVRHGVWRAPGRPART